MSQNDEVQAILQLAWQQLSSIPGVTGVHFDHRTRTIVVSVSNINVPLPINNIVGFPIRKSLGNPSAL